MKTVSFFFFCVCCSNAHVIIPDFKRQPGNRSRLNRVYRFIMELVNFSPLLFKLFMISLLCKRLLILHYLTNVHIYFVFIFVHNFLVLFFHLIRSTLYLYRTYSEIGCRRPRLMVKNCCNFFKHNCYLYSVQTGPKR